MHKFITVLTLAVALLLGSTQAHAIGTLEEYLTDLGASFVDADDFAPEEGFYTALNADADDTDLFIIDDADLGGTVELFNNQMPAGGDGFLAFGTFFEVTNGAPTSFIFEDQTAPTGSVTFAGEVDSFVQAFELTADLSAADLGLDFVGIVDDFLPAGTIIFGFDDFIVADDDDFNDLIMAFIPGGLTQAIPVPGAVWLLGAGMAAMLGLRKRA